MQRAAIITIIAAASGIAAADIVRVDEFQSVHIEGFESAPMDQFQYGAASVFDGMGEVLNSTNSFIYHAQATAFSYNGQNYQATPYEGSYAIGAYTGPIEYRFTSAQQSFGGYFASFAQAPGGSVAFYNGTTYIGSGALDAPAGGIWTWNGFVTDTPFDRAVVSSGTISGGMLAHDAVRVSETRVPAPASIAVFAGAIVCTRRRRRAQ